MKKILLFSLALMTALSFYSCKDDKNDGGSAADADRLFRPMFRIDNNTGKGSTDPYNSVVVDRNNVHLYWYLVNDAKAYEVKWSTQAHVANGEQAWIDAENRIDGKELNGHVVISDPAKFDLFIENMNYQTSYRFAIRALNSFDAGSYPLFDNQSGVYNILDSGDATWKNDPKNSLWYGYGEGREWAEYLGIETEARYGVPYVIQVSNITKTSMHLTLNRNISSYKADDQAEFREHFNVDDNGNLKIDYLTIAANASTPNATVPSQYTHLDLSSVAWDEKGIYELDIEGLSDNSCYNIDVWDASIKVSVDACYNTTMKRTKGDPAAPVIIEHKAWATDTIGKGTASEAVYDISQYNAMKIDDILNGYCANSTASENQVFYLEGGKAYYTSTSISVYKGFTLATNPADLAAGKGRAKFYLNGLSITGNTPNTCNFMLGRQPVSGENGSITLDIDSIRFMDLDVDCPMAYNYGHAQEGITGSATGNYFMNMYPNGMGINVTTLEWRNCSFQGLIRGFFRIQGSNDFYIQHIRLVDCDFYNCGYYSNNAGDYAYIFADHNGKTKSNILQDVEVSGCVFYNCPKRSVITDNNRNLNWDESVRWHINVHHNTFVNFSTIAKGVSIINTRYNPGGSLLEFHDNVIILTKDPADVNRAMNGAGWDTREIQGGDNSNRCTFNIYNNWTTNDEEYLTNGQPFASNAFDATSNAPAKWLPALKVEPDAEALIKTYYPAGENELKVHLDESLRATDLMISPNPKYFMGTEVYNHLDFHTDNGIEGLYYQQTDKVLNSAIYKSGAGCQRLRNGK
jgi:hypothetical protein